MSEEILCKLRVTKTATHDYNQEARQITLTAQYDSNIEEDKKFAKATPNASFEMYVDNPTAIERLTLGREFYVTLRPIEK